VPPETVTEIGPDVTVPDAAAPAFEPFEKEGTDTEKPLPLPDPEMPTPANAAAAPVM